MIHIFPSGYEPNLATTSHFFPLINLVEEKMKGCGWPRVTGHNQIAALVIVLPNKAVQEES